MKNEKLLKELIKRDYTIPLNQIEQLDLILTRARIRTVKDYDKLLKYLDGYTKRSEKTLPLWTKETTGQLYYEYVECMKDVDEFERFPRDDLYYLIEARKSAKEEVEKNIEKMIQQRTEEILQQSRKSDLWAGCDAK